MAANVQSSAAENVAEQLLKVTNDTYLEQSQQVDCEAISRNELIVNIGIGCAENTITNTKDVDVAQDSTARCVLDAGQEQDLTSQVKNDLKQAIKQVAENSLSSEQEFMALALSVQTSDLVNETLMDTQIDNLFEGITSQYCDSAVESYNKGEINICGNAGNINFSQDGYATTKTTCTQDILQKIINENKVVQDADQDAKATLTSTQKGIFAGLAALVGLAVIILIIYLVSKKSGGTKSGGATATPLGASPGKIPPPVPPRP